MFISIRAHRRVANSQTAAIPALVLAAEDSNAGAITCGEHGCDAARQKDFTVHVPAYLGYQPRLAVRTNTLL